MDRNNDERSRRIQVLLFPITYDSFFDASEVFESNHFVCFIIYLSKTLNCIFLSVCLSSFPVLALFVLFRYAVTSVSTLRPNVISVAWNITFVSGNTPSPSSISLPHFPGPGPVLSTLEISRLICTFLYFIHFLNPCNV